MAYETFEKIEGIIRNISMGDSCCSILVSVSHESNIINIAVTGDTVIIDNVRLRPGMRIAAFYDANLPVPAVYPPQYRAEIVTTLKRGQQVKLDYFDDNLVSSDGTLKLQPGPAASILMLNGQPYMCSPENAELLVYYTAASYSIPASAVPQKIIVMCQY